LGEWSGTYFSGMPLTLRASPKQDYTFIGWINRGGELVSAEKELKLRPDQDLFLYALFK
jgi:heme/copper-type cytochrome/quinol oxidase subunit 2